MARSLASKINVTPPGGNYPYGRVKDNTGSGDGTPVDENLLGDLIQYFEKLMEIGGLTANGLPENSADGFQYITALTNFVANYVTFYVSAEATTRAAADTTLTNTKVAKSGDSMTGPLYMGGNKITGLAAGTTAGDAARYDELNSEATTRASADSTEASIRAAADTTLQNEISALPIITFINTGDWNMNSTPSISVAHGLTASKIRSVFVSIYADIGSGLDTRSLESNSGGGTAADGGGYISWTSTNINLAAVVGGLFNNASYDATSFNRGVIMIISIP